MLKRSIFPCLIIMLFSMNTNARDIEVTISPLALISGDLGLEAGYEISPRLKAGIEGVFNGLLYKPSIGDDKLSGFNGGLVFSYKFLTLGENVEVRGGAALSYVHFVLDKSGYTWNMTGPQVLSEFRQKFGKHFVWRGGVGGLLRTKDIINEDLKKWVNEASVGQVIITFDIMAGIVF